MLKPTRVRLWMAVVAVMLLAAGCGGTEDEPVGTASAEESGSTAAVEETPSDDLYVVVTTTILGDIVRGLVGDTATVDVLLAVGADPHDFQLSSQDGAKLRQADLVVANGLGLEESLEAVFESARQDGIPVLEVAEHVDPLEWGEGMGHDEEEGHHDEEEGEEEGDHDEEEGDHDEEEGDHDEEEGEEEGDHDEEEGDHDEEEGEEEGDHDEEEGDHDEEEGDHDEEEGEEEGDHDEEEGDHDEEEGDHDEEEDHGHEGNFDPHFWFDPSRMELAVREIADALIALGLGLSAEEWNERAEQQIAVIREAADEAREILLAVPASERKLVTNHDSFSYFGQYFGFEILDTILSGGSTLAQPGTAHLAGLVETIREEGSKAIFTETTADSRLPRTVAAEFDPPLRVVELYTGSLGPAGSDADTYPKWLVTNARLIAEGLTG